MIKTTILAFTLSLSLLPLSVLGATEDDLASNRPTTQARVAGPIGGVSGQTLRVSVARLGPFNCLPTCSDDDGKFLIRLYDADATDLPPLATLESEVEPGRSLHLDYPLGSTRTREEVVVRLEVVDAKDSHRDRPFRYTASIQVIDQASGTNQLWGDWFIIDDGR